MANFIVQANATPLVTTKLCLEAQVIGRMVSLTDEFSHAQVEVVEEATGDVLGYYLSGESFVMIQGSFEPDDLEENKWFCLAWDIRGMTLHQYFKGYGNDKATQDEDYLAVIQQLAARYGVEKYLPSEQDWKKGNEE